MAKLIKQKFLQGIDSSKFEIAQNGALMARDSNGDLVEILKLSPTDQVLLLGQTIATSAELDALTAQLTQEIADRQADVNAEESRAMAAEAQIASDLAAEVSRATAAEGVLDGKIDQEIADRQADVNAEESRAMAAEAQISSDLAAEVVRATAAESSLASDISAEQSRAEAAESALDGRLDVVEAELPLKAAITYVDAQDAATLQSGKDYTDQKITDLVNGAPAVLDTLKELADALGNDENFAVSIANQIAGVESDVAAEVARAEAAEAQIAADLASEVSRATAAEGVLDGKIDAEEARAMAAEAQIASDLAAEVVRATAAEGQVASDLAAEVVRATAAEAQIASDLVAEAAARDAEDLTFLKLDGSRTMSGALSINEGGNGNFGYYGSEYFALSLNNTTALNVYVQMNSYIPTSDGGPRAETVIETTSASQSGGYPGNLIQIGHVIQLAADSRVSFAYYNRITGATSEFGSVLKDGSDMKVQAVAGLKLSSASDIKMLVPVSMESNQIKNLASPSDSSDAATKGYVDSAQSSVAADLATEVARAQAAEAQIASDLAAEVVRAQGEEARIEGKLDAITWKAHYVALVGAQPITDQYIDLPDLIVPGSLFLSTDLVVWYEGVHYTTSTVAGKTRVNFIGDMATGGQCAIESDDDLYAKYQYLA